MHYPDEPDCLVELNRKSEFRRHVVLIVESIMNSRESIEQCYRARLGVIRLEGHVGKYRLGVVCEKVVFHCFPRHRTVVTILENYQEFKLLSEAQEEKPLPAHNNIRSTENF